MNKRLGTILEIVSPIIAIAAWWILSEDSSSKFFPPLSKIANTFYEDWIFESVPEDIFASLLHFGDGFVIADRVQEHLIPSLTRLGIGYALAVIGGIAIGTILGMSRPLRQGMAPINEFLRALPPPVLIPFGILMLGIGAEMKIFVIAIGSIWPVLLNTLDGVRGVDTMLLDMARIYKVSWLNRIVLIILPAASPQIFAGMRTSLSISVILMVISEMVASVNGVGYYVLRSQRSFRLPEMWAGIIMLGLIGYVLNVIFIFMERRILRWHRGSRAALRGDADSKAPNQVD